MNLKDLKCVCDDVNIDIYINFIDNIKQSMEYPEWLGDFSKQDLNIMLNNGSKIFIYYLDNEPVCSIIFIPSDKKSISKFELDLDYHKVADYGPMFVNPKYVGNGLQYQMLVEMDKYCINSGYKYSISTVHLNNTYSINNLLKDKFVMCGQKNFKRGIRNIYLKCLDNE